jgi:hypothetical protein
VVKRARLLACVARLLACLASLAAACEPAVDDSTSLVTSPRLLAVQASPGDAALGKAFAMKPLYVDGHGTLDPSGLDWAICLRQKPLGEPGPIDPGCFVDASPDLVPLGHVRPVRPGGSVAGTIPPNACEFFGPDSPPPMPGQPSARPTDPDTTGGFYLPIRVKSGAGDWSVALERIACAPSGVTQGVFVEFTSDYKPNTNPVVSSLTTVSAGVAHTVTPDGEAAAGAGPSARVDGAPGLVVGAGDVVALRAEWPVCAGTDPCGGAESYLFIDPATKAITSRRESMVANWYATGGRFDEDRNGRGEGDPEASVTSTWTAPGTPGTVHLWVVLRDARGGVGWGSYTVQIR